MRNLLLALFALALLVLAASPAWAGETCEGNGYSVEIPDGFKEAVHVDGGGTFNVRSNCGNVPIDGMPETTVYMMGSATDSIALIVVSRMELKSDMQIGNLGALMRQGIEQMRTRVPDGVDVETRTISGFEGIEATFDLSMLDQDLTMRMLMVYGESHVTTVMMQTSNDKFPGAKSTWDTMIGTLEVSARSNKVLLYGGIGLGALLFVFVLVKVTGNRAAPIEYADRGDWRRPSLAPDARDVSEPAAPYASPVPPPAPPPGLRPTVAPPAPPPGLRSTVTSSAGRPGLRSTLPPSGS